MNRPFEHYGHTDDGNLDLEGPRRCGKCGTREGSGAAGKICPNAEMIHIDILKRELDAMMANFGGIKSGKKIKKKVNQLYKRDITRLTQKRVDERLEEMNKLVKEKPKWMPKWLWGKIYDLVLRDHVEV